MANQISRRNFLKIGTLGALSGILAGCQMPRRWVVLEPYVRPPEEQLAGVATWYASTCRMCPAGCGIIARVMNGRALKIEGNPEHPLNQGKLCARGQAGVQLLYHPDRLTSPVTLARRGTRELAPVSWQEGIQLLSTRLQAANNRFAVWAGATISEHLYSLFQQFATAQGAPAPLIYDAFIELSGRPALRNADNAVFGKNELPAYPLADADVVISFNSDILGPSQSQVRYGIEYGKFRSQPNGKRGYLVQLEPRQTLTGAKSDLWLPIRPGTEGLVAQAMLRIIADQGLGPQDRAARARQAAGQVDINTAATLADIPVDELVHLATIFAKYPRSVAIPGGHLAGQPGGLDALKAIQSLNFVAGMAGTPGGMMLNPGPALPEMLQKPPQAAFAEARQLIERMRSGDIQVLLIHSANPFYELSEVTGFAEALSRVPFMVSFSPILDETSLQADLILPDRTYLESWGTKIIDPVFETPVLGSQQPVVSPRFDARSTADVLLTAAKSIPNAARVMPWNDEVAFLKAAVAQLPVPAYGGTGPDVLWASFLQHGGWWPAAPAAAQPAAGGAPPSVQINTPQFQGDEGQFPFLLYMYMSDYMTTGGGAALPFLQGVPDPLTTVAWQTLVEVHPETASRIGVADGDIVKVTSPYGEIEGYIYTYPAIRPDTIAIAVGQGHTEFGRYASQRGANPLKLVGSQTDPADGHLLWSNIRVQITRTGRKAALALFEWKEGVRQGFVNAGFPGE